MCVNNAELQFIMEDWCNLEWEHLKCSKAHFCKYFYNEKIRHIVFASILFTFCALDRTKKLPRNCFSSEISWWGPPPPPPPTHTLRILPHVTLQNFGRCLCNLFEGAWLCYKTLPLQAQLCQADKATLILAWIWVAKQEDLDNTQYRWVRPI